MMLLLGIFIKWIMLIGAVIAQSKIRYMATEHPELSWFNPKYVRYVNLTSQRYGRSDPFYYVGFHVDIITPLYHNVNVDFYFYEYLSNQYKRSFVELHFELCELINKDGFFGLPLKQFFPRSCPIAPGEIHITNITIPIKNIPYNFPFTKGRIQANFTSTSDNELMGFGHVDMEIKEVSIRKIKNNQS